MSATQQKILIIEDEEPLANMLADKLQAEGFNTQVAYEGQSGLKAALSWLPDLILLDLIMPKMDGMTMLRRLRQEEKGKMVRVILLTNLSDTSKVFEAVSLGVNDYLVKTNWDLDEIINEIQNKLTAK
ncbi:MAG TPA: response regulator [Candidatus Saccharimonadales bacterium]|nr:response regulator [Candidatus Saccharimonadales bacterium]